MNHSPKILIIDDEPIARSTLEALLAGEEYELYLVDNGITGLETADHILPDVILLDVMMPVMSGFEVCKKIRGNPVISEMPILMITALDDRQSRLEGLRAGADDFITKPFDRLELLVRLNGITRLNRFRRIAEQRRELELLVSYERTIEGWSDALDLRDKETEGHTLRVTEKTLRLARLAGAPKDQMQHIRRGGLLHDVGKLGIPDAILLKPGKLSEEEWVVMRRHPMYAYQWLSKIPYLEPALDIPYCHHEKWDGTGYPRGLKGESIPLAARLFAVIDVWDAITSDRPYRKAMDCGEALQYILAQSGKQFEPRIASLFSEHVDEF